MNEKLFHEIAEQVEQEFMCSGLTGGLYEDFAKEILVRYLAAQQSVQADDCPSCAGSGKKEVGGMLLTCLACDGTGNRR